MSGMVRNTKRRWLLRVGMLTALTLLFLCWWAALDGVEQVGRQSGGALVTLREDTLLATDIRRMREVEERAGTGEAFALWTQLDGRYLSASLTGASAQVSVLLVRGDSRLVLPVSAVLAEGDTGGCIIDRETSRKLYGHPAAVGAVLRYDGRDYTIRGVFDSPGATMLLQAGLEEETALEQISMSDGEKAADFLRRHRLEGQVQSQAPYRQLAGLLGSLPMIAVLLLVFFRLLRQRRRDRDYPVRYVLWTLLLFLLVTAGAIWMLVSLPSQWTPSRWSDFSFWSTAYAGWKKGLGDWAAAPRLRPDLLLLRRTAQALWGVVATACLLFLRRLWRALCGLSTQIQ